MIRTLILLLLLSTSAIAQVNLNQGLIGHYPLDGNPNDASGNNINGVVTNATLTTDRYGNPNSAYYFNGVNAYIQLPYSPLHNIAPHDSFSISVWVLADQGANSWPAKALVVKSPYNADVTQSAWNYGIYLWQYKAMSGYHPVNFLNGTTLFVDNPCWYNIIVTYKNGVWKLYVNGVLEDSDASQTHFILQDGPASRIAFARKGDAPGDWFKGKLDEIRIYNRVLNQQEVFAIVGTCYAPCPQKNDFSIQRSACNPLTVSYTSSATNYNSIRWDFGDGNLANGNPSTTNTYLNPGTYQVVMITDYASCSDTVKKTIIVDLQDDNQLISTADTTICKGASKQIKTTAGLDYCWSPTTFLQDPNVANPITTTPQTITYYLTSYKTGPNLIVNGDFSAGNTGFTSSYLYSPSSGFNPGVYNVGNNIQAWHPAMSPCSDHTTGNGNMMMVNGASTPNVVVWSETVPVQPNTNYAFSTWLQHITTINPASLQFSINGNRIGPIFNANSTSCIWEQFYSMWNSGTSTMAVISIVNQNQIASGNDFALDDITFTTVSMKRDSVKIAVDTPNIVTNNNTTICEKTPVQLNTTGAASYSWSPSTGLSSTSIPNPVATPTTTTQYVVTGTTSHGCIGTDTVLITVNPVPIVTRSADTTICENTTVQLFATGGGTYSWTPPGTLSNPNVANPVASPTSLTKYYVTVTNGFNCRTVDSVKVDVRTLPVFSVTPPADMCFQKSAQLDAGGGDVYSWTPVASLSDPTVHNPVATPANTTTYTVVITDTLCSHTQTLSTVVTVLPLPTVNAAKSNDIDCTNDHSQLLATGATQYSWSPAATLDNPAISNPVASPVSPTLYTVTGTDAKGCKNTATITVDVTVTNKGGYLMASAFTPNGDGLNDCYGIKFWGIIEQLEFSIYNRWGQLIFYSKDPGACWDGTYQGKKQDSGVYVYMIKAKTTCESTVFRKGFFTLIR